MKYVQEQVAIKNWIISIFHVLLVWLWKSVPRAYCSIGGDEGYGSLLLLKQNFCRSKKYVSIYFEYLIKSLYLYTLIIGHKSCHMLSILNKLTMKRELQNSVTNSMFRTKRKNKTTTKQKKSNIKDNEIC